MNIEHVRKDLDQKLSSKGYVHPEKPTLVQNHREPQYKVITVTDEKAQYRSSNSVPTPYKNFSQEIPFGSNVKSIPRSRSEETREVRSHSECGKCNEEAQFRCKCAEYGDMMCKNGHVWYVAKDGRIVYEDPHIDE